MDQPTMPQLKATIFDMESLSGKTSNYNYSHNRKTIKVIKIIHDFNLELRRMNNIIGEVPTPSLGAGYKIVKAVDAGKPVSMTFIIPFDLF
jgi:hypothetical protein